MSAIVHHSTLCWQRSYVASWPHGPLCCRCNASLRPSDLLDLSATAAKPEQWTIVSARSVFPELHWTTCQLRKSWTRPFRQSHSVWTCSHSNSDHDSSKRASGLMEREDLCGMCFCDAHFHTASTPRRDKVCDGCTVTCSSEAESKMRNRRQLRQLPSDKLTSRNRSEPSRTQWNCHTSRLKGYSLFSTRAPRRVCLKAAHVDQHNNLSN